MAGRHLDAVEAEQVGCLFEVVDHVVDLGRELVDVLAVERRQVLRVEQDDEVAGDRVACRLGRLHLLLGDAGVRMLAKAALDEVRHLEGVLARAREEHEEFGRLGGEGDLHGRRTLTNWRHV